MALLVEGQDFTTDCEHDNPRQCHARIPEHGAPYHVYRRFHVWDSERDDYALGTNPGQFERRRDAKRWVEQHT